MTQFKIYKLGELIDIQNGYAFKSEDLKTTGIPIIKIKNIQPPNISLAEADYYPHEVNERLKQFQAEKKDILISMTGSHVSQIASAVGKVGRYGFDKPALINQRVGKLYSKDRSKLNNDYLYYFIARPEIQFELATNAGGSANQANISPQDIKELEIDLPDIESQTFIASILSSLADKIELNRRTNHTLEQIAQTLFKKYFVDDIDPENLPEGWRWGKVSDLGKVICGKTPSKASQEYFDGEIPFIKIPDMHGEVFIIETSDSLTKLGAQSQLNKFVPKGSICVSCIATVGLVGIPSNDSQTNQQINTIVPYQEIFTNYTYFLMLENVKHLKELGSGGTATLNVNTTLFSNIEILIPNKNEVEKYHNDSNAIMHQIYNYQKQNILLSKVRDCLLPKLMSGEIEVNAFEKELVNQ